MPEPDSPHLAQIDLALAGLGQAWRGDWSDFDGRTLRHQLDQLRAALKDPAFDATRWLTLAGICPEHHCWFLHCDGPCEDAAYALVAHPPEATR